MLWLCGLRVSDFFLEFGFDCGVYGFGCMGVVCVLVVCSDLLVLAG